MGSIPDRVLARVTRPFAIALAGAALAWTLVPGVPGAAPPGPALRSAAEAPTLPAFRAETLGGGVFDTKALAGRRVAMVFLEPGGRLSGELAPRLRELSELRAAHNFELVGVLSGELDTARAFLAQERFGFPVLHDATRVLKARLGAPAKRVAMVFDSRGELAAESSTSGPVLSTTGVRIDGELRDALRLPPTGAAYHGVAGTRPLAPEIAGRVLDGEARFELSSLRGRPVVVIFFLHTCPLCQRTLELVRDTVRKLPAAQRPAVVGVEIAHRAEATRASLAKRGLDFFPVLLDPTERLRTAYGVFAHVPDVFLVDAEGRIAQRIRGWRQGHERALFRMGVARLVGAPVPMLLERAGYSGSERCGTCHEREYETWRLTAHSQAFETLVRHGADAREDCVGCHSVGFGDPGGFTTSAATPGLEDVGCESCHGRGGPHYSPKFISEESGGYAAVCTTCHDPEHSLGFAFGEFLPRISHAANAPWLEVAAEQRPSFGAGSLRSDRERLPQVASHVGSESCASCHPAQYEKWQAGPHAHAFATLEGLGQSQAEECLGCHTTGLGRDGGFDPHTPASGQRDLARVGCESCHGPGGHHVGPEAPRRGTIVALTEMCDSCAILPVCGRCHDAKNDPGFDFEVLDKIDAIRHGGRVTADPGSNEEGGEAAASPP